MYTKPIFTAGSPAIGLKGGSVGNSLRTIINREVIKKLSQTIVKKLPGNIPEKRNKAPIIRGLLTIMYDLNWSRSSFLYNVFLFID